MEEISKKQYSKDILNIIRTTMRNSIELTHIADNKANVLLSLNALMLTFLIPFTIPYFDVIQHYNLAFPLVLLILTCLVTIYISAMVLKPSKFAENRTELNNGFRVSPFFFGNFYKMNREEFSLYMQGAVSQKEMIKGHLTDDLHYIGTILGKKMELIRLAFSIFLIGLISSISFALLFIYIFE